MNTWELKINDPSLPGWLCVVVYLIAGAFAFRASRFASTFKERTFSCGISLSCGLLAFNKQLDIHSLVLMALQTIANGGKPGLTLFEFFVLIVFGGAASCAATFLLMHFKGSTFKMWAAAGCLVFLGALLIARSTIPVMSAFLGWHFVTEAQTLMHIHLSEVFEMAIAGVIAVTATQASRTATPSE